MLLDWIIYFSFPVHKAIYNGMFNPHMQLLILKSISFYMVGLNNAFLVSLLIQWTLTWYCTPLFFSFFKQGIESMYNLAQKCIQLKPRSSTHRLSVLMIGILEENTEVIIGLLLSMPLYLFHRFGPTATAAAYFPHYSVSWFNLSLHILNLNEHFAMSQVVLAECSREFGPWWDAFSSTVNWL